ncbi:MAG: TonB-dependent receptor domain-containing protein [Bacteroidota bacterium]
MRATIAGLFFLFYAFSSSAQEFSVKGVIMDNTNNPVPFANVLLLRSSDSLLVKGGITDDKGVFTLETTEAGTFRLMSSYTGMKKTYSNEFSLSAENTSVDLGSFTLQEDALMLEEAVVMAQKPFIEHHLDKTVVNVENSIVAAGSTALEVLKRSPGVMVDKDDNISLKGKNGVSIMIDGKLTYLSNQDVAAMLKSLPADQVEKIELITNPSAKFDAEGTAGIINIVLKKNQNYGWNGRVNAGMGLGYYEDGYGFDKNIFIKQNGGINLNYRSKRWNYFGSYNYNGGEGFNKFIIERKFRENGDISNIFNQTSDGLNFNNTHSGKVGIDFFINKKHTIGFFANGMMNTGEDEGLNSTLISEADGSLMSSSGTSSLSNDNWKNLTANLNYKFNIDTTGKELTINVDYASFNSRTSQNYRTDYFDSAGTNLNIPYILKSQLPSDVIIYSAKADYVHPIGEKMKIEAGVKSSYVTTDNNAQFWYEDTTGTDIVDTTKTNHFIYTENINAAYINYAVELNDKWNMMLGLRTEQTNSFGDQVTTDTSFERHYIGFFPSGFLTYKASDKHEWNFTYSRRIERPDYQSLNPFIYFLDPYTYMQGNTNLLPQYTNSFELTHTFMGFMTTTASYSHTSGVITEITKQVDSTFSTFATSDNLSSQDNMSLSVYVPIPLGKSWTMMNYISGFNNRFRGVIQDSTFDKSYTSFMINSQNMFRFKKGWSAELSVFYMSPQVYGIFVMKSMANITLGIQKTFLKDRGNLKVSFNDIFWTSRWRSAVEFQNMDIKMHAYNSSRMMNVSFTYKFGNSKAQYQRKESGASDELDRVKKGE